MRRIRLPKWLACVTLSAGLMMTGASAFSDTEGHWQNGRLINGVKSIKSFRDTMTERSGRIIPLPAEHLQVFWTDSCIL